MANLRPTPERLFAIRERQVDGRWGCDYVPSIFGTVREAPSCSRPSLLYWRPFSRDLHCLSTPETAASLLALYQPALFDLHEQKMLSPEPRCHPLFGHPRAHGVSLPPLRGTVEVAERLNALKWHPTVVLRRPGEAGVHVPFPWVGDLLLFLQFDSEAFCVDWNVKQGRGDHDKPFRGSTRKVPSSRSIEQARVRHSVQSTYYRDAGIISKDVSLEEIPFPVYRNLECLFLETKRPIPLSQEDEDDIVEKFSLAMKYGVPPMATCEQLALHFGVDRSISRRILYQSIWFRRLRVDLHSPILMDKPLVPERIDVLDRFAHWFRV